MTVFLRCSFVKWEVGPSYSHTCGEFCTLGQKKISSDLLLASALQILSPEVTNSFFASNILILQCWANLTYFSVYKPAFFNLHILFNFWSRMIIKSISMFFKVRILIQVIFVLITVLSRVITVFYLKSHSGPKPTELWIGKKENVEKLCLRSLQLTLVLFPGFFMEVYVVGKAFTW